MNNDLVRLACEQAVRSFGVADTFNGASFASVFARLAGMEGRLDGCYVRAILTGRPDIEILEGSCHYRLLSLRAVAQRYQSYSVTDEQPAKMKADPMCGPFRGALP